MEPPRRARLRRQFVLARSTEIVGEYEKPRHEGGAWEAFECENRFQFTEPGQYWVDVGGIVELEKKARGDGKELKLGLRARVLARSARLLHTMAIGQGAAPLALAVFASKTTTLRTLCALFALAATLCARAQTPDLVFSVTEGVTYQATPKDIRDKFEPIVELIGKALNRKVKIVLVPAYDDVRAGLARQEFDVAFIHPAHVAMAAIKTGRYHSVAWTAGFTDYTVSLMSKPEQPYKDLKDVRGTVLVTPDPDSITAWMVRAMLRTENFAAKDVKVITTRYQDAVPFYLEYDFAQVGATAANAVVKEWTSKGGKVFAKSRSVPIKLFIMSSRLPADDRIKLRDALVGLSQTEAGRRALATTGYKGFVAPDPSVEATSIAWLGL